MKSSNPSTTCSNCGEQTHVARGIYRFRESGLGNVFLVNIDMIRCSQCGNEDPVIPHLNELMSVLALAVIRKPCPLNGNEVRFLRKYLKMTGEQFGQVLGVGKHHVSKWENGADPVGPQSDRLIRAVAVVLGHNLQSHQEQIGRVFADIDPTVREIEFKIDPEAEEIQYA
jgi:putative zinc finger/helix-turn-helix YgiT family protein